MFFLNIYVLVIFLFSCYHRKTSQETSVFCRPANTDFEKEEVT